MKNRTQLGSELEQRLVELAQARLSELGIDLELVSLGPEPGGGDPAVILSRGDTAATYSLRVKAAMTLTSLAWEPPVGAHQVLVVGTYVSRRSADALREANFQFIDTVGNAFITFGGVFIDVRGRPDPAERAHVKVPKFGGSQSSNLFSRSRAQIILALLAWPELAGGSRRAVAYAAGVSLGQAQDALSLLAKAGFLLPGSTTVNRFGELLDLWSAAYPTGLGPRLALAQFHGDLARPLKSDHPVYLSGEAASGVDVGRPTALTVYLDSLEPKLALANRWSANPDRISNVFVRRKFWTSPRGTEDDREIKARNAPWPLVYADLMAAGDARLAEVARTWRTSRARSDQG